MATFLITGVAGFVGSNLAEGLLRRGHTVRVIDDFLTGRRENLVGLPGLDFREADILETDALDLVDALRSLMPEKELRIEHLPPRSGDVRDSLADVSRAREVLGYEPRMSVREGIARAFAWYRSSHS